MNDPRELTLKDIAEELGMTVSLLSDIEQGRRKPFSGDKIQHFCEFLNLSEEETALAFDLASRNTGEIPADIDNLMMYTEAGSMARYAMRLTGKGRITEQDWQEFIAKFSGAESIGTASGSTAGTNGIAPGADGPEHGKSTGAGHND